MVWNSEINKNPQVSRLTGDLIEHADCVGGTIILFYQTTEGYLSLFLVFHRKLFCNTFSSNNKNFFQLHLHLAPNKKYEKLKTISYLHEQIQNVKKTKNSFVPMERNVVNGNARILRIIPIAILNATLVMRVSHTKNSYKSVSMMKS